MLILAACSGGDSGQSAAPPDLETAAIERGLVRDPSEREVVGLYARDTDRLCVVKQSDGYRVGAFVDYGEGLGCTGRGRATRSGDRLTVKLDVDGGGKCEFDAKFDGDRITFPANLPEGCAGLCQRNASLAALDVERLSESAAEAKSLRTPDGNRPCGS